MEIETLKHSHLKRNIIIGVIVVLIISAIILNFTRAKYRSVATTPLIHSEINYSLADLNIVAITVDGEKVDTIPEGNYELTSESYCEVDGSRDDSISLSYDSSTQTLNVIPFTTKGTKCYLYFDVKPITNVQELIASKNIDNSRSGAITGTLTTDTTGTVYSVADDWGTSYVFAGAPTDNWVRFAGFYWRIIRINGDGSIRLIYSGVADSDKPDNTNTTGTSTQISTSDYNSRYNDNAYVGYMYGSTGASSYASTHANTKNSTIKGVLDNWYKTNIADKGYSDKVSIEAGFCNDRRVATSSETFWTSDTKRGYGTNTTAYAPFSRFLTTSNSWNSSSQKPTLKCSQMANDMFTVSGSSKGNHKLTYPVGLITADEVVLAGGFGGTANQSYYLYTNQYYWTMSPYSYYGGWARVFRVISTGGLYYSSVDSAWGVRPVINLKADVTITGGNGSSSSPFDVIA